MDRLAATGDGRVEVTGRWFGVRGRRFVRPALTLTVGDGVPERRCLAELEHKPWAAQDGEPWTAVFPVDIDLKDASTVELSVAPDIEVALRSPAGGARSPRATQDAAMRRPSARAPDVERLTSQLSAAEAARERERERRVGVQQALEEQRAESRRLSAELGRVRAELDLARTVQREGEATAAELDSTRRAMRALQRGYDELTQEHDRALDAHSRVEGELRERSGALESARDALDQERERAAEALAQERARGTEAFVPVPDDERDDPEPGRGERRPRERAHESRARTVAPQRTERPRNPALRSRPNWVWRVLALLVIIAVVVAIWLVLHSTILH